MSWEIFKLNPDAEFGNYDGLRYECDECETELCIYGKGCPYREENQEESKPEINLLPVEIDPC